MATNQWKCEVNEYRPKCTSGEDPENAPGAIRIDSVMDVVTVAATTTSMINCEVIPEMWK